MSRVILTEEQLDDIRSLRDYLNTTSQFQDLFKNTTGKKVSYDIGDLLRMPNFLPHGASLLFSWLGLLNCVVEGWLALRLKDQTIDNLIGSVTSRSKEAEALNEFRHGVFHFQRKKKPLYTDFIYSPDLLKWALNLNLEFEKWFDYNFTANTLPRDEPGYEWFKITNGDDVDRSP